MSGSSSGSGGRIRTQTILLLTLGTSLVFAFVLLCLVSTQSEFEPQEYQSALVSNGPLFLGVGPAATNILRAGEVMSCQISPLLRNPENRVLFRIATNAL